MEMHQVRYFLALCDSLSFTRAAEQCHVSQPALTTAIRKLEAELGGPLFHRVGRRMVLTELGRLMRPHLEQVAGQAEAARNAADSFRLLRQAPLNLGVLSTIGPGRIARFLNRFGHDHPGIELAVQDGPGPELAERLDSGALDLAILSSPEPFGADLRIEPLYRERYVVAFPPGHRFEAMDAVRFCDTSGEPYVDRLSCEMRDSVMALARDRNVELYAAFRSTREDWIQGMVLAGIGFAFLPEYSVSLAGLLSRPLIEPTVERAVCLARMAGRQLMPASAALAGAARRHPWPG